ncbi:MAG: hypothetical protein IPN42_03195 [Methylococcaceae bacterium]|nr:hypothetical protein [Methylococcaceae bacterium]
MEINSIEDAKKYAAQKIIRCLSLDETNKRLVVYRDLLCKAVDEETKEICQQEIISLEAWLESVYFKTGNFPQGINELMLELVEWRASIYAFQNTETEKSPFKEHIFYSQWLVGGTYAVFAILGKLVMHQDKFSLIKLWKKVCKFIEQDGVFSKEELKYLKEKLDKESGFFTKKNSKAYEFRHKVIAHNEKNLTIKWDEIDKDIEILVRIWSLIVSWSSYRPDFSIKFRTPEQALSGIENYFTPLEVLLLKAKRKEYISRVILWSRTHLHNSEIDPESGIFFTLN